MKRVFWTAALIGVSVSTAFAGAIDRTNQPIGIIFEDGRYFELSFAGASPSVSGVGGLVTPGALSGDMTKSYFQFGAAYKADINENFSYALILDQPFGADVDYPTGTGYFAGGSTAELNTLAMTGILKYTTDSNISVYGGVRAQSLEAAAVVPFIPGGYSASTEKDYAFGYVVGAAYEKPEIALRVALTFNSDIEHNLSTTETSGALGGPNLSTTEITTPKSINLDLQTGIAEGTLLFGGVRWADWSNFDISPADYIAIVGTPLVSYPNDVVTYTLGLGRRLNENWSIAGSVNYEKHHGDPTGNLGPTDGRLGATLAAVYTMDNIKITAGVSYVDVGNADTIVGPAVPGGIFTGNSAIGAGVRVGFSF